MQEMKGYVAVEIKYTTPAYTKTDALSLLYEAFIAY
jgi:hypothetical protein